MSRTDNGPQKTDEEEVFEEFGITDDDEKARVRGLAAARVLATRKNAKLNPPQKKKGWGED